MSCCHTKRVIGGPCYALDVVEQLVPLADEAGPSLTHPAMAFVIAHPGVTAVTQPTLRRRPLDERTAV